jgi:hypothetical protein
MRKTQGPCIWMLKERWPQGAASEFISVVNTQLRCALFGQVATDLWNCSKRFWGRKVSRVYLVVRIVLSEYLLQTLTQSWWHRPLLGNTTRCCVRLWLCLPFSGDSSRVVSDGHWEKPFWTRHCHWSQDESTETAIASSRGRSENGHRKWLWSGGSG